MSASLRADREERDDAEQRERCGQQYDDAATKRGDEVLTLGRRERPTTHRALRRGGVRRDARREHDQGNSEKKSVSRHRATAAAAAPGDPIV